MRKLQSMKRVLITKGPYSGIIGEHVYTFFRHTDGYCRADEPSTGDGWTSVHWIVPVFDHCGQPSIVEVFDGEFVVS